MITLFAKLLTALNSDDNPSQMALAIVFAAIMGLTPLSSPHNVVMLLLLLTLRINLTMFLLSFAVFSALAILVDPISQMIGLALLQTESLKTLWTELYNSHFWRVLAFNNTRVLGSVVLSLGLSLPLFFVSRRLVINYRDHVLEWVKKTRLAAWLKGSKLLTAYNSIRH